MAQYSFTDSRIKNAALAALFGFLFLGFLLNLIDGDLSGSGWIWGIIFTFAFPICLMNAIKPGHMTLDQNGFKLKMFIRNAEAHWAEIEEIKFYKQAGNHFFKFKKHGEKWKSKNSQIPMGFKIKPKEFAEIITAFHAAAHSGHTIQPSHAPAVTSHHPQVATPYQTAPATPYQPQPATPYQPEPAMPYQAQTPEPYPAQTATPYQPQAATPYQAQAASPYPAQEHSPRQPSAAVPYQPQTATPYQPQTATPYQPQPATPYLPEPVADHQHPERMAGVQRAGRFFGG